MIVDFCIVVLLTLLPTLIWCLYFYFQDVEKEPRHWLIASFVSGMLAVLPVLGFSEAWRILFGTGWQTWIGSFTVGIGIIQIVSFFFLAAIEEFFKHRAVISIGSELQLQFNELSDGLIYSATAAVGFAFVENILYLWANLQQGVTLFSPLFWEIYLFRGFGTMLGHMIFSSVFGFFWGLAVIAILQENSFFRRDEGRPLRQFYMKFVRSSDPNKSLLRKLYETASLQTLRHFIAQTEAQRGQLTITSLIAEGFWLATLLHFGFNVLVSWQWQGQSLMFLVIPPVYLALLYISRRLIPLSSLNLTIEIPAEKRQLMDKIPQMTRK